MLPADEVQRVWVTLGSCVTRVCLSFNILTCKMGGTNITHRPGQCPCLEVASPSACHVGPVASESPAAVAERGQHSLWGAGPGGAGLWPRCRLLAPFTPGGLHPLVPGLVQTAVGHPAQPWEERGRLGHLPAGGKLCFRRALPQASPAPQLTEQDPRTAAHAQACGC